MPRDTTTGALTWKRLDVVLGQPFEHLRERGFVGAGIDLGKLAEPISEDLIRYVLTAIQRTGKSVDNRPVAVRGRGRYRTGMSPDSDTTGPDARTIRGMLAMWANVALWQIGRLEDAVDTYLTAEAEGSFRAAFEQGGRPPEWRSTYEEYTATMTLAEYWRMAAERYFLLHALAQVRKCVVALPDDELPAVRDMKVLRLLRDIDEHWEQLDGRSLREMRDRDPNVRPGAMWLNNKHIWVGDVNTAELALWLTSLDQAVRERSAARGFPITSADTLLQFPAA